MFPDKTGDPRRATSSSATQLLIHIHDACKYPLAFDQEKTKRYSASGGAVVRHQMHRELCGVRRVGADERRL